MGELFSTVQPLLYTGLVHHALNCRYNQNFSGLYCECHRPYPDPEDPVTTDCMVQVHLCMVQVQLYMVQVQLCMVQVQLCMVQVQL